MKMNDYKRKWDNASRRWIYEHRMIMQDAIKRPLHKDEHIHHIDENPLNNNLSNLMVVTKREHIMIHNPSKHRVNNDRRCLVARCDKKHHAKGYCHTHYEALRLGRNIYKDQ
jgi:hypothetical protein